MSYVIHLEGHEPFSVEAEDMKIDNSNDRVRFSDTNGDTIEDIHVDLDAVEAIIPQSLWSAK
jgi:hypothetical protein